MHSSRSIAFVVGLASIAMLERASAQTLSSPVTVNTDLGTQTSGAGVTATMAGQGSGTNGPETAQFGANLSCSKDSWMTTSTVGEIDCVNISLHQGGPGSDGSGVLIGAQNTGQGFINDIEMVASTVDTSNDSTPFYEDIQLGSITSDQQMYGATLNAVTGAGVAALYVNAEGSASWGNVIQAAKGGSIYFSVDDNGNITTSGTVSTASLSTSGPIHATSSIVAPLPKSDVIEKASCGTTIRSTDAVPVTLVVPSGLPVGCQISVIQASDGTITFEGRNTKAEHLGTPDAKPLQTQGRYAEAQLLIDSPRTFLLRGDVGTDHARSVNFVSDLRPAGEDAHPAFLQWSSSASRRVTLARTF